MTLQRRFFFFSIHLQRVHRTARASRYEILGYAYASSWRPILKLTIPVSPVIKSWSRH